MENKIIEVSRKRLIITNQTEMISEFLPWPRHSGSLFISALPLEFSQRFPRFARTA